MRVSVGKTQAGECSSFSKVGDEPQPGSNPEALDSGLGLERQLSCYPLLEDRVSTHSTPLVLTPILEDLAPSSGY